MLVTVMMRISVELVVPDHELVLETEFPLAVHDNVEVVSFYTLPAENVAMTKAFTGIGVTDVKVKVYATFLMNGCVILTSERELMTREGVAY